MRTVCFPVMICTGVNHVIDNVFNHGVRLYSLSVVPSLVLTAFFKQCKLK